MVSICTQIACFKGNMGDLGEDDIFSRTSLLIKNVFLKVRLTDERETLTRHSKVLCALLRA